MAKRRFRLLLPPFLFADLLATGKHNVVEVADEASARRCLA